MPNSPFTNLYPLFFVKPIKFAGSVFKKLIWPWLVSRGYFSRRTTGNELLYILPQEGLGDFFLLIPAIKELSLRNRKIVILCRKWVFDTISSLTDLPSNVYHQRFKHFGRGYIFKRRYHKVYDRRGVIIKLGHYSGDPIFNYPECFYIKLGCSLNLLKSDNFRIKLLPWVEITRPFEYRNLQTSKGKIIVDRPEREDLVVVDYLSPEKIKIDGELYDVPASKSLAINLYLASQAEFATLSDGGFFNIVVATKLLKKFCLIPRKHKHSHSSILYSGIVFNGRACKLELVSGTYKVLECDDVHGV